MPVPVVRKFPGVAIKKLQVVLEDTGGGVAGAARIMYAHAEALAKTRSSAAAAR